VAAESEKGKGAKAKGKGRGKGKESDKGKEKPKARGKNKDKAAVKCKDEADDCKGKGKSKSKSEGEDEENAKANGGEEPRQQQQHHHRHHRPSARGVISVSGDVVDALEEFGKQRNETNAAFLTKHNLPAVRFSPPSRNRGGFVAADFSRDNQTLSMVSEGRIPIDFAVHPSDITEGEFVVLWNGCFAVVQDERYGPIVVQVDFIWRNTAGRYTEYTVKAFPFADRMKTPCASETEEGIPRLVKSTYTKHILLADTCRKMQVVRVAYEDEEYPADVGYVITNTCYASRDEPETKRIDVDGEEVEEEVEASSKPGFLRLWCHRLPTKAAERVEARRLVDLDVFPLPLPTPRLVADPPAKLSLSIPAVPALSAPKDGTARRAKPAKSSKGKGKGKEKEKEQEKNPVKSSGVQRKRVKPAERSKSCGTLLLKKDDSNDENRSEEEVAAKESENDDDNNNETVVDGDDDDDEEDDDYEGGEIEVEVPSDIDSKPQAPQRRTAAAVAMAMMTPPPPAVARKTAPGTPPRKKAPKTAANRIAQRATPTATPLRSVGARSSSTSSSADVVGGGSVADAGYIAAADGLVDQLRVCSVDLLTFKACCVRTRHTGHLGAIDAALKQLSVVCDIVTST